MIESSNLPKEKACMDLGVSRQAFYKWKKHEYIPSSDDNLLEGMQRIALEFIKYGYRRMTKALQRQGQNVNHKKVYRIMTSSAG